MLVLVWCFACFCFRVVVQLLSLVLLLGVWAVMVVCLVNSVVWLCLLFVLFVAG